MKHNLKIPVHTFNGQPLTQAGPDGAMVPTTLQASLELACVNADPRIYNDAEKKVKIYRVLVKVHKADPICDLTAEDVTLLKELTGQFLSVTAVGPVHDLLEDPIQCTEEQA